MCFMVIDFSIAHLSLTIGQTSPCMEPGFARHRHTMMHVQSPLSSEDPFALSKRNALLSLTLILL